MTHSIVEAMWRDPCSVARHEFLNSRSTGTMALVDIASANWFESGSIDWTQHAADRRSRGKKTLARFPRSVMALKVNQLVEDYA